MAVIKRAAWTAADYPKGTSMGVHGGIQKGANTVGGKTHRPLLPMDQPGGKLPAMNIRRKRIELNEKLRKRPGMTA